MQSLEKVNAENLIQKLNILKEKSKSLSDDEEALMKLYSEFCEGFGSLYDYLQPPCLILLEFENFFRSLLAKLFANKPSSM